MKSQTILIRVDGSDRIGMGHVARCVSLVRQLALAKPFEPVFVMKSLPHGVPWVRELGYAVEPLPPEGSTQDEVEHVRALVACRPAACVVTDLRTLTPGLIEAAKAAGALTIVIDEWGHKTIRSALLTNGTIVPAWHHYDIEGNVACYIGARYALLDRQFAEYHGHKKAAHGGQGRVLIALGGDDPCLLTAKTMQALEASARSLNITAVIGPGFIDEDTLRQRAARSRHRYTMLCNVSNMAQLMAWADLGICGGGLVALEMACTGTPSMILCEVPHQLETAAVLQAQAAAVDLGFGVAVPDQALAREVDALLGDADRRRTMGLAGSNLIDGKGCMRLAQVLTEALDAWSMDESDRAGVPLGR